MSEPKMFAEIPAAAARVLEREGVRDFDVFLPASGEEAPVLYRRSGSGLSGPDFERMVEHGITRLYVRAADHTKCERILEDRLSDILANPNVPPDDKADILHNTGTSMARSFMGDSVGSIEIDRISMVVDNVIGSVVHDPAVTAYLLEMAGHERSTAGHMFSVSTLAVMLGAAAFGPDPETLRRLGLAGMFHDLGKLSISADILNKPGALSREELNLIHQHPIESARLVSEDVRVDQTVRQMIIQHHERVDGRGYPLGTSGADLLPGSKVISIVDSFHALVGQRPYQPLVTLPRAVNVLAAQAGKQFDADLLAVWKETFEHYWAQQPEKRKLDVLQKPDEISSRHEHRPTPPPPRITHARQTRHACKGKTAVRCIYAGRLTDVTPAPDEFNALVHDVSRGGLSIYSAQPMYRGEIVHTEIMVQGRPVWVTATVAWCRPHDPTSYRVGLRFTQRASEAESHEPREPLTIQETVEVSRVPVSARSETEEGESQETASEPTHEPAGGKEENALKTLAAIASLRRADAAAQRTAITLATTGDVKTRLKAIDVLLSIGTKSTRAALVTLLRDANPEVRERAVIAAGTVRARESADTLRDLLDDPVERVALRAAGSLGKLGDRSGLPLIETMLQNDGPSARLAAAALGDVTGHRFSANREGVESARRYLDAKKFVLGQ